MIKFFLFLAFAFLLEAKTIDAVAVVIGDDIITLYDIKEEMSLSHVTKKQAVDILIRKKLEAQEIKKRDITVSDDEVYDEIRKLASANHLSISQFYDAVRESNGLSSSELKEKIKERLLSQKLYQAIAVSKLSEPTQSEIEEYYKLHKNEFNKIPFFDVIIYTSPNQELLKRKIQNPMFFSPSVKEEKQRISSSNISPQLYNVLAKTKKYHFTPILPQNQNTFMTFYIENKPNPAKSNIEDIKPQISNAIMNDKRKAILDDYFAKLKDNTEIKFVKIKE